MPYLRNAIIFLVPLIGFAAFQAATAPLRYELWKLTSDAVNAILSPGTDPLDWNHIRDWNRIRDLELRLAIYTWSLFVLIGVVTGILIRNRLSAEQAANAWIAMSIGIGTAMILLGVNDMSWFDNELNIGLAVLFAISVVWIKAKIAAHRARRRVK